jgi:hypothetical protein
MPHAILLIYRIRFEGVEVRHEGELLALHKQGAQDYFERVFLYGSRRAQENAAASVRLARSNFRNTITIREGVPSKNPVTRTLGADELVDEVTIGHEVVELYAGRGKRYVEAEIERRYPEPDATRAPDFTSWWETTSIQIEMWSAEFLTASGSEPIKVEGDERTNRKFPVRLALEELDRLESNGWHLVHVSEDRGVDEKGAGNEAYVASARYLVTKLPLP